MKRIIDHNQQRSSKRIRIATALDSWNYPVHTWITDFINGIPDIWSEIFKHIDMKQVWTFLFVSKTHHNWICFNLQEFDATVCSNSYIPICQNLFPNITTLKTQFASDDLNNFWTTIPKSYPRLLTLDIDFENSQYCPAKLLDWIRLSPDAFKESKSNGNPDIDLDLDGRRIQHLILRNKSGDNLDCQLRYGLLQVSELTLYNCVFSGLVYKNLMVIKQLKTINITMILPTDTDIHILTDSINDRNDVQFNISLFFRNVFNPASIHNLKYIGDDHRPNLILTTTVW